MHKSIRLERTLEYLKSEFYDIGNEWLKTKDPDQIHELHALIGAINHIEIFLYDRKITTIFDVV